MILKTPEVHGALISVLGENYITHSHRYCHTRQPEAGSLSQEELAEKVASGCHQDSYSPASQGRSHRSGYARVMYYSQDTPIQMGPTHVLAGTHFHDALTAEDRQGIQPVEGAAGLVFLSDFDIGHGAGVNMGDRRRIYRAPYNLEPAWRDLWDWHCGVKHTEPATIGEAQEIADLISHRWDTALNRKRPY